MSGPHTEQPSGPREGKAGERTPWPAMEDTRLPGPLAGSPGARQKHSLSHPRNLQQNISLTDALMQVDLCCGVSRSRLACGEGRRPLQGLLAGPRPLLHLRVWRGACPMRVSANTFSHVHGRLGTARTVSLAAAFLRPAVRPRWGQPLSPAPGWPVTQVGLEHCPSWATGTGPGMAM